MQESKVAPPHISSEKYPILSSSPATGNMCLIGILVARSDW
jgi:hypothetical protein